jgi:hypothetical protein
MINVRLAETEIKFPSNSLGIDSAESPYDLRNVYVARAHTRTYDIFVAFARSSVVEKVIRILSVYIEKQAGTAA